MRGADGKGARSDGEAMMARRSSRRQFLRWSGALAASVLAGWPATGRGGMLERLFHGRPAKPIAPITSNEEFYLTSYRSPPTIRLADWRLHIGGLVERPFSLSYEDLLRRPSVTQIVTLECIGNTVGGEYIGTARWEGVPLASLLEEAGIAPEAYDVALHAADDYSDSLQVRRVLAEDVLVAHRMNGVPLPAAHGFPARLIVPGHYGMKSVQWLTTIEAADRDYQGYYQQKGWSDEAVVKTTSWIAAPVHGAALKGRRHQVEGVAYAGIRGIQRVEVSVDEGGSWQEAVLAPPMAPAAWNFWRYEWEVSRPGRYGLLVRATDGTGRIQSEEEQGPAPDGSTGMHQITVKVEP